MQCSWAIGQLGRACSDGRPWSRARPRESNGLGAAGSLGFEEGRAESAAVDARGRESREELLVGGRPRPGTLPRIASADSHPVLRETADGNPDPARLDVVGSLPEQHRSLDDFGAQLRKVGSGLDPTDEVEMISDPAHLAKDMQCFDHAEPATLAKRELPLEQLGRPVAHPVVEGRLGKENAVFHAPGSLGGYTTARMALLETIARIVELGGTPERAGRVAELRRDFESCTGAFVPDDPWFEERSRAFWCDAVTRGRFGRTVQDELTAVERGWLPPLERAHRGLFRTDGRLLVDVWSGAELRPTLVADDSRAELDAAAGQLFDARVVGTANPILVALLPGAVFHPRHATVAIESVLAAARAAALPTTETLDALLRMERTLRAFSRVKAAYAYRPEALPLSTPSAPVRALEKSHN